jgi:lysine biosynthesis protein LysW
MYGSCPECDSRINVGDKPHEGQKVTCQNCWAYLHIIGLSPIELDWIYEEEDEEYWEEEAEYEG